MGEVRAYQKSGVRDQLVRPAFAKASASKMTTFDDFRTTFDDVVTFVVAGALRMVGAGYVLDQRVADRCGNGMKGY